MKSQQQNRQLVNYDKESEEYLDSIFEGELGPDYSFSEYLMDNFHYENGEYWYDNEEEEE